LTIATTSSSLGRKRVCVAAVKLGTRGSLPAWASASTAARLPRGRAAVPLVVVGRPLALTRSYWVRREVEMFHNAGRERVVINVDGAVEAALAAPPKGSLAAWLADNREMRDDGSPVYPMLI
jgi:hypothetical protein